MHRSIFSLALILLISPCYGTDFLEMTERLPPGGNALMAIDIPQVLASKMAKANGWDQKINEGGFDRPLHLPPEAEKMLTVSQIDIARGFSTNWKVGLFDMTESIPMRLIARVEGGYLDQINDLEAVWIPSDAYLIDGKDNILCMQSPADRQAIVRWHDQMQPTAQVGVSDYLTSALVRAGKGPQIVIALDAENSVQPQRAGAELKQSGFADQHRLDGQQLLTLISSIKGIKFEITITDSVAANVSIDFNTDVNLNPITAKALVEAVMERNQMSLPESDQAKFTVVGKSILVAGEMTSESLRRVLSIMAPASTKFSSLKDENVEESSADDMAKNSLAYFKSIQSYLEDLKSKSRSSGSDAYWIDRYAGVIDKLPILHVDPELLDYGQKLTVTLRQMSGTRKQTRMEGGIAARSNYVNSGYGYDGYDYQTPAGAIVSAGNAKANAAASGSMAKIQGFNLIDSATTDIRRKMTSKYNVEF